jgi:hypothetical protein
LKKIPVHLSETGRDSVQIVAAYLYSRKDAIFVPVVDIPSVDNDKISFSGRWVWKNEMAIILSRSDR